jgi:hypothetical protein
MSGGLLVKIERHIIEFRTREEFERVWPAVLRLKSKGAPITLRTPDKPKTDPTDPYVVHDKPQVWIICPILEQGRYELLPDGTYAHIGPWTDDLELPNGVLPERVVKRKKDAKWVVWESDYRHRPRDYEFPAQQARVQVVLYVDSEVIDLNRIRLPENTPIEDKRLFDKNKETPSK